VGCLEGTDTAGKSKGAGYSSNDNVVDKTKKTGCSSNNSSINKNEGTGCKVSVAV
jgi:hypothetical protein